MALHIKALDGPVRGQMFPLRAGFAMGRSEGDLVIPGDTKLSSRHAYVQADENGTLNLVDNDSKNGLRINGELIPRVKLVVGIKILIGTHVYEIVEHASVAPAPTPKSRYWHEVLVDFTKKHLVAVGNVPRAIIPLHPAVVLDFVRGLQAETRWVLGYGPRKVGAKSMDLPIFENGAPDICFEILPTPDGISFKTDHPELVKLNGRSTPAEILRIADVIKIHDTEIEVDFIE